MLARSHLRSVKNLFNIRKATVFNRNPQFLVDSTTGFLPRDLPLEELPPQFEKLENLLQRMPKRIRSDGSEGLLQKGTFGETVLEELPDYSSIVEQVEDTQLILALFRDYAFAVSGYLLEPCDIEYRKTKTYGLGRDRLPKQLAVPISILAKKLGAKPFLEYAQSHTLSNFALIDKNAENPMDFHNMRLIRYFDGSDDEEGFILVHTSLTTHSAELVRCSRQILDAASWNDRKEFDKALKDLSVVVSDIIVVMDSMWTRSSSPGFADFRSFMMGITGNKSFPNGVVYEGCFNNEPQFFRGVTAANDSVVPTIDNLLQLTNHLPDNPLTATLREFRQYRPSDHQFWLEEVQRRADKVGVMAYAKKNSRSAVLYMENLDKLRAFRMMHWNFVKEYIIKYSPSGVGTGGSPIATWLPNQLETTMQLIMTIGHEVDLTELNEEERALYDRLMANAEAQRKILKREVAALSEKYGKQP